MHAMEDAVSPIARRPRGRPARGQSRNVALELMAAAERCLRTKNSRELTIAEIAEAAGATEAMIAYYFNGKDGLYASLMDLSAREITRQMRMLEAEIPNMTDNPSRRLADTLQAVIDTYPGVTALVISERLRQTSEVKEVYSRKYARHSLTLLQHVLEAYQNAGFYRRDIDLRYGALAIMTLVSARASLAPVLPAMGFTEEEFRDDAWIGFIADSLERMFGI